MVRFIYSATDENGQLKDGFVEANNEQSARDSLEDMNLNVNYLKESEPQEEKEIGFSKLSGDMYPEKSIEFNLTGEAFEKTDSQKHEQPQKEIKTTWQMNEINSAQMKNHESALTAETPPNKEINEIAKKYYSFSSTIRIYVGWLLFICLLMFSLGSYQSVRDLSFEIPYVSGLFLSRNIIIFTFGWFLFLLSSSLYGYLKKSLIGGMIMTLFFMVTFYIFIVNT